MWAIIPHLEFLTCLAIAACVTPTDPILAQAVVGGRFAAKHVPAHIRHLLSAESGCNDGAAFPFLCEYDGTAFQLHPLMESLSPSSRLVSDSQYR